MNVSDIVDMEIGDDGEPRTAESALGDDPRRMLKANGEAEVVAAPMTIAEQLEAVKAEEAEMLRKFEKTHKRFIKVMLNLSITTTVTVVVFLICLPSDILFPADETPTPSPALEYQ